MAIEVSEHVAYWREGSREDASAASALLASDHIRHALFFAHLSLEKALKAHICFYTRELPPKIHNLGLLAERSGLSIDDRTLDWLAELERYNLAGRYPDAITPAPSKTEAASILARVTEVLTWLNSQSSQ